MKQNLFRQLDQLAIDRWTRGAIRTMLCAAWLSLSVWCLGYAAILLLGWPLQRLALTAIALGMLGGAALVLALRGRLRPAQVARRLDRRFKLNEQLSTALEVSAAGKASGPIAERLVAESTRTLAILRRRINARARPPWAEVTALIALALVLLGLTILASIQGGPSTIAALPLPGLRPPDAEAPPPPEEPLAQEQPQAQTAPQNEQAPGQAQPQTAPQPGGQAAAERIADALRDQAPTRSAAEAIDQGNLAGAASELRELADQASALSERSRESLAQQLRDAAEDLRPSAPELAQQLEQSAAGLEQGGQAAAQALDDLARAIESLQQGGQPGDGQGQGSGEQGGQSPGGSLGSGDGGQGQQQESPADRLGVEGVPLELEGEGEGENVTGNAEGQQSTRRVPPSETNSGREQSGDVVTTGEDPLRIPAELRDVVQGYFSPED
jgi:hypothetical protein